MSMLHYILFLTYILDTATAISVVAMKSIVHDPTVYLTAAVTVTITAATQEVNHQVTTSSPSPVATAKATSRPAIRFCLDPNLQLDFGRGF